MKRPRVSRERRLFEGRALRLLKEAGADAYELARCRRLLVQGRKKAGEPLAVAMNKAGAERVGVEIMAALFRGEPPPPLLIRFNPQPATTQHG